VVVEYVVVVEFVVVVLEVKVAKSEQSMIYVLFVTPCNASHAS
jgi:hypothetical protein